ncbi:DUF3047 domain-containing protein [Alginatibacterium sediminis]|nr:DUF3047 domain-containing protein [Alginatibacterium sediminis]
MQTWIVALALLLAFGIPATSAQSTINISNFEQDSLDSWQTREFSGFTKYETTTIDGIPALSASASASASGLVKAVNIDLFETPYLNWSWRIEQALLNLVESEKDGDDFAARIYLICEDRWFKWNTIAINYVWSSQPQNLKPWGNPFAPKNAKMLAIRHQQSPNQRWVYEKRNVYQDLILAFGDKGSDSANEKAYRYINAVAIMTDTDNSKGVAKALYGDISFTAN